MIDETKLRALVRDEVRCVIREELASNTSEFLSVADAARAASVSPQTIRKWMSEGKLPRHAAGRVLRIRRTDLEKCLTTRAPSPSTESPEELALAAYAVARGG